jgi:hypothetical protein
MNNPPNPFGDQAGNPGSFNPTASNSTAGNPTASNEWSQWGPDPTGSSASAPASGPTFPASPVGHTGIPGGPGMPGLPGGSGQSGDIGMSSPVVNPTPRTGGGWKKAVAGLGVVGLIGGGAFAAINLAGPGSNTPTEAVQDFFAAASTSDVIGLMETLAPGERDLMIDTAVPMLEELKRLEVLQPQTDLKGVKGLSLKFNGQTYSITTVAVSAGSVTTSGDPRQLFGNTLSQFFGEDAQPETSTEDFGKTPLRLATIKRDGRWYVSFTYSVAEAGRRSSGEAMPPKADAVQPAGAANPEAAVREMLDAAASLDARKAIALLDPDEFGALQDYAPLFLADAEREAARAKENYSLSFPNLGLTSQQDGKTAKVQVTKWSADFKLIGVDSAGLQFLVDGDCISITSEGDTKKRCGKELPKLVSDFTGETDAETEDLLGKYDTGWLSNPSQSGSMITVQRKGKWFIAPMRTGMNAWVDALRGLNPEDLKGEGKTPEERITSLLEDQLFGSALGTTGLFGSGIGGTDFPGGSTPQTPEDADPTFGFDDPGLTTTLPGESTDLFGESVESSSTETTVPGSGATDESAVPPVGDLDRNGDGQITPEEEALWDKEFADFMAEIEASSESPSETISPTLPS